jgi:hypothetical protein
MMLGTNTYICRPATECVGLVTQRGATSARRDGCLYSAAVPRARLSLAIVVILTASSVLACGKSSKPRSASYPGGAAGSASAPAEEELTAETFTAAQADTRVTVREVEYRIDVSPVRLTGPKVFFTVTNAGTEQHEFQIRDSKDRRLFPIARLDPGVTKTLSVDLFPGTYQLQCLIVKGVQTHAMLGEQATVTVTTK